MNAASVCPSVCLSVCDLISTTKPFVGLSVYEILPKSFFKKCVQHERILWKEVHWQLSSTNEFYENQCINSCPACTNFVKIGVLAVVQHARVL
jgi:hypothetical protein